MSQDGNVSLSKEEIEYFKNNKNLITSELLGALRSLGNKGKQNALDILDISKNEEECYIDAFNNPITFNGKSGLKKPATKIDLSYIHTEEIEKCFNDINYFKDNYVKIKTRKGINFPDLREYQEEIIDTISSDESEKTVLLMGRQSGKSITVAIYLAWAVLFMNDMNIGIVGNKGKQAMEFLKNVKEIFLALPIWMQQGIRVWNKGGVEFENGMRILTDVPTSDAFRGYTISILIVDECAFIPENNWKEFEDSIFPSQEGLSWKKSIILSTANGLNHFYEIVKKARKGEGYNIVEVDWKDVPRYDKNGNQLTPEEFRRKQVERYGNIYFNQNFANEFYGSSNTMISAGIIEQLDSQDPNFVKDRYLHVFVAPQPKHKYILAVDPSKDGEDAFAIQVIDITTINFDQVASGQIQIDYLQMPEFLNDWGRYYNQALIIIENNEGAGQSVADQLFQIYEYENIYFDKGTHDRTRKRFPGFRTTKTSRKLILSILKLFIESGKLKIRDSRTINEFYRFILVNGKYQADAGAHDDMVMALAIAFAPFCNFKNFSDITDIINKITTVDSNETDEDEFTDMMMVGFFDG